VSKQFSRAAYFYNGRKPDGASKPTTLTESGDRSPKGFGYVNTGSKNGNIIEQGGADANKFFQAGAETNESQAAQAYKGFMNMRKTKLITDLQDRGQDKEMSLNRKQSKLRLKGEVF
jgi:hypothetical protein